MGYKERTRGHGHKTSELIKSRKPAKEVRQGGGIKEDTEMESREILAIFLPYRNCWAGTMSGPTSSGKKPAELREYKSEEERAH